MAGMFDMASRLKAADAVQTAQLADGVRGAKRATPEQIRAAADALRARGIQPTAVNVAEELAVMAKTPVPTPPPPQPGAGRAGPQVSPETLERIKALQQERNRLVLEQALAERRRLSGAR